MRRNVGRSGTGGVMTWRVNTRDGNVGMTVEEREGECQANVTILEHVIRCASKEICI